jgi:hypothetical protein
MGESAMSSFNARIPLLALAATAGSIAAVSVTLSRPEALIDRSLNAALSRMGGGSAVTASRLSDGAETGLLKLSSTGSVDGPAGLGQALAVGDRITIAAKDGARRTLEVADVRPLAETGGAQAEGADGNLLLVTCNVLGGAPGEVVRFVIEDGRHHAPALPATQHRAL